MLVPRFTIAFVNKGNGWDNAPIIPHAFIALLAEAPTTSARSYITLEAEVCVGLRWATHVQFRQ